MATPEPVPFEKEVVRLTDGRQLILFHFQAPSARPESPAPVPPRPPAGER